MKGYAALVQNILGQIAAQGERLAALLEWRDPRASMAFCSVCLVLAMFLFFAPIRSAFRFTSSNLILPWPLLLHTASNLIAFFVPTAH
jgi:hypothetical protein